MRLAPTRIRVADLAIFREKPADRIPSSPPHVVVEIVSPGDRYIEIHDKLEEYRRWGITHIWLMDPMSRTFSVFDDAGLREVPVLELPEYELTIQKSDVFE
jgi:Uma2 family endonuclease